MPIHCKVRRERLTEEDDIWFHEAVACRTVRDCSCGDGGVHRLDGKRIAAVYAAMSEGGAKGNGREDVSLSYE